MFLKKGLLFASLLAFLAALGGCATTGKKSDLELQGLKNDITALEAQIQAKDQEITTLKDELDRVISEREALSTQKQEVTIKAKKKRVIGEVKSRPNIKQIQIALLNAGYDPGSIDGKMGHQTREAVKSFQSANGLHPDGQVGKNTWKLLRPYLYKKIK